MAACVCLIVIPQNGGVYFDLFFVDVCLEPSLNIVALVKGVISCNPLMLFLLLFDVVFCL